jgi:hypothetical protein
MSFGGGALRDGGGCIGYETDNARSGIQWIVGG